MFQGLFRPYLLIFSTRYLASSFAFASISGPLNRVVVRIALTSLYARRGFERLSAGVDDVECLNFHFRKKARISGGFVKQLWLQGSDPTLAVPLSPTQNSSSLAISHTLSTPRLFYPVKLNPAQRRSQHIDIVSLRLSSSSSGMHNGRALKKADPSTIQDKLLVGYQGWFTCAGDGEPGRCRSPTSSLRRQRLFAHPPDPLDLRWPPLIDYESCTTRRIEQSEEAITDGSTGSTTPCRMVDVRIQTSGPMCQNTTAQNSTKHQGSKPEVARNVICSLQGTRRL